MAGLEGVQPLVAKLAQLADKTSEASHRGLLDWGEHVLEQAQRIVPIETGALSGSGRVASENGQVAVGFGSGAAAAYALIQHEDLTFKHDAGRTAKYLEKPVVESAEQAEILIGNRIKAVLGG